MEKPIKRGRKIVSHMMEHDAFSQWLGIEVKDIQPGYSQLEMTIRPEMLNGFHILHGGISYSLADSALAFASNSHGQQAVSVETSISHIKPCKNGDTIVATATEKSISRKIAIYQIEVHNQNKETIALFKGTVYRSSKEWEID